MARSPKDLHKFEALNVQEKSTGKKIPWKERADLIRQEFPSTYQLDWAEAFRDIELFGRILRDILRIDQSAESRNGPGPRPVLDPEAGRHRLRQLMGADYSHEPFPIALATLAGDRSIRSLANKVGINPTLVFKLLRGKRSPELFMLEQVASAFNKDPSYFVEYRIAYILGALGDQMDLAPEITVDLYRKLRHGR